MINLRKQALAIAVKAIYFDDSSDYGTALWGIVQLLGGEDAVQLLEENSREAYEKYCTLPLTLY